MFKRLRAWLAERAERRREKISADTVEPVFFGERINSDEAVVFVHGLAGHFRDTWKEFPSLIKTDPDLPELDVLLAGYDASLFPWTESIETEAKRFASNLRSIFPEKEAVFLVGHSMGGLIILQGLIHEMQNNRANERPVNAVRHVTLYASPTMGSELAAVIKLTLGKLPAFKKVISEQIEELSTGGFCSKLIREVANRIYNPSIQPGDVSSKRQIEVTACVGTKDIAVKSESAESIFNRQAPVYLDHDHFSIKEPVSRKDLRYLPMKNILAKYFIDWLPRCVAQPQGQRSQAVSDALLLRRIRHALVARLASAKDLHWEQKSEEDKEEWVLRYFSVVLDPAGFYAGASFSTLLNNALLML
jgi:pimeloyl-ACP methyl ester carboxylesterase